jgi:anhydro-N-acetylmuramic acid kinase
MAYVLGLMTGTSLDGLDIACCDFTVNPAGTLVHEHCYQMPEDLRARVQRVVAHQEDGLAFVAQLEGALMRWYAACVHEFCQAYGVAIEAIEAIGMHGQTVRHCPGGESGYTVQLGDASLLAALTGCLVVSDFRRKDVALGGQGAPFAPIFHAQLLAGKRPCAVLNLGGIANVTLCLPEQTLGFDTGPANGLMDLWAQRHGRGDYDAGGAWAASGQVIAPLLEQMLAEEFFARQGPKSTGLDAFNSKWLASFALDQYKPEDVQATLLALTVRSVGEALAPYGSQLSAVYLAGGGVHNRALFTGLVQGLNPLRVDSIAVLGVHPDALEAMMVAWLAQQRLARRILPLAGVTGARAEGVCGGVYC